MPYRKNTWQSGDIITKVKLDNIEEGIFDNSFVYGLSFLEKPDNTIECKSSDDEIDGLYDFLEPSEGIPSQRLAFAKYETGDGIVNCLILSDLDFSDDSTFKFRGLGENSDGDLCVITLTMTITNGAHPYEITNTVTYTPIEGTPNS